MRCIAVTNQKGGVGKTTTVANLGMALARLGRRVCCLDLDAQCHLTASLGFRDSPASQPTAWPTVWQLLDGAASLDQAAAALPAEGHPPMHLVPGSPLLAGADMALATRIGRELLLRKALAGAAFDYVLLDCPPNLGVVTVNALCAAGEVLAPVQAEYLALQSLAELMRTMDAVREQLNPALRLTGVLLTRFSKAKTLNREVAASLRRHFGEILLETRVRENVALAEAPGFGQDILRYRPRSTGADDYRALARELDSQANDGTPTPPSDKEPSHGR